jgi:hypothetical protein
MLNKNQIKSIIKIPPDLNSKFTPLLTSKEIELLGSAIYKIKTVQLLDLTKKIATFLQDTIKNQKLNQKAVETILNLATLTKIQEKELINIFRLRAPSETDKQIQTALQDLGIYSDDLYRSTYYFRHHYFLDKPTPKRISEGLLKKDNANISIFLQGKYDGATEEEIVLLGRAYPLAKRKEPFFPREADSDIVLTINEIQLLITNIANANIVRLRKNLDTPENYEFCISSSISAAYTIQSLVDLIKKNDFKEMDKIISENNGEYINYYNGMSLLSYAIKYQKLNFVTYLIKVMEIEDHDSRGYSALHYAVKGESEEIVKLLLSQKCNVNSIDIDGYSAMHIAAALGKANYVEQLLQNGADPNLRTNNNLYTPLHIAALANQVEVIKILLESKKAETGMRDSSNQTAANIAKKIDPKTYAAFNEVKANSELIEIEELRSWLIDPKKNEAVLSAKLQFFQCTDNPFLKFDREAPVPQGPVYKYYFDIVSSKYKEKIEYINKFNQLLHRLQRLREEGNFSYKYQIINELIQEAQDNQINFIAFNFEVYKHGFLKQLICLQEKKPPLQVVIEEKQEAGKTDEETIRRILAKQPNQSELITYEGREIPLIKYALLLKKTSFIFTLIAETKNNTNVKLGTTKEIQKELSEELIELYYANIAFRAVIFLEQDTGQKTIYRVYSSKKYNCKVRWYDYYLNNKYIASYSEKISNEEENDGQISEEDFAKQLGNVKRHFDKNNFSNDVLTNDTTKNTVKAIFNLANTKGKDSTIIEKVKNTPLLSIDTLNNLKKLIRENKLEDFKEIIKVNDILSEQLQETLIEAITLNNLFFVNYLIDYGVIKIHLHYLRVITYYLYFYIMVMLTKVTVIFVILM